MPRIPWSPRQVVMGKKPDVVSLTLDRELRVALEMAARSDHRSVEALIQIILYDWLTQKKHLKRASETI